MSTEFPSHFEEKYTSQIPESESIALPQSRLEYIRKFGRINRVSHFLKEVTEELLEDPEFIHSEQWIAAQEEAKKFNKDYPYKEIPRTNDQSDQ